MKNACLLSPWVVGDPSSKNEAMRANHPAFADAFPSASFSEMIGHAGPRIKNKAVNMTLLSVTADDATAAKILADPVWGPRVLWMDGVKKSTDQVSVAEHAANLSAFAKEGIPPAKLQQVLGAAPAGKTRQDVAGLMSAYLKSL